MGEFMPVRGTVYRLIIERILGAGGIDLTLPNENLEIFETVSGSILRVVLPATQPSVGFLQALTERDAVVIAIRDGLGQRLFRAVKKSEHGGDSPDGSSVRFVFSLTG